MHQGLVGVQGRGCGDIMQGREGGGRAQGSMPGEQAMRAASCAAQHSNTRLEDSVAPREGLSARKR